MTVLDDTGDITELEKFSPERVDAVDHPATGIGFLLLKRTGASQAAPESTEEAVAPVAGTPQDEDVAKDWAAYDAAHPSSGRKPAATPAKPKTPAKPRKPKKPGKTPAGNWQRAHQTLQEVQQGGKPSKADLANAHAVHEEHEAHLAHLAAEAAAAKPKATAKKSTVTVELPRDVSVSFTPADLAKLVALKRQLADEEAAAKRDMDPKVGGGVDRDKIPAEDFAGKDRSFPIVTPKDVHDAAASVGRAGDDNYPADKLKANIIAIARRKGKAHVDQLPDAWKDDGKAAKEAAGEPEGTQEPAAAAAKGKPFPGAAPPFKAKDGDDGDVDDDGGSDDDGGDDGDDDGDSAEKSGRACKCGSMLAKDAKFCSRCGKPAVAKARACKCGTAMAKDAKFCSRCGEKSPGKASKGKVPSPEDAAVAGAIDRAKEAIGDALDAQDSDPDKDSHPADRAVSAHLDEAKHAIGNADDAQDEDIDTDDPAEHAEKSAAGDGPAYHLRRLHDATCAAYRHEDVVIAHPAAAKGIGAVTDPEAFAAMTQAALTEDGGTGSRARDIPALSAAFAHAVTLKAMAASGGLDEAMDGLRKAFAEYYPDAHVTPGSISPGQFKRPYISAGHAPESAPAGQKPRIPLAANVPAASDFRRPLITAGREAASPGSNPAPAGAQKAGRTYYTNAGRDSAASALTAMHDWIAGAHPGICPMGGSAVPPAAAAAPVPQQFAATKDKAVPVPVSAATAHAAVTPSVTKAERKAAVKAARKADQMAQQAAETAPADAPASPQFDPEVLKSVLREVVAEQLGDVIKANGDLAQRIADLESAPDPAQMTPRSGSAVAKTGGAGPQVPEGGDGHMAERLARLVKRAKDPDGGVRAAAIGELIDTAGREAAAQLLEAAY